MKIRKVYSEFEGIAGPNGERRYIQVEVICVREDALVWAYFMYAGMSAVSSLDLDNVLDKTWVQLDAFGDARAQRLGIANFDRLKVEALEAMNQLVTANPFEAA